MSKVGTINNAHVLISDAEFISTAASQNLLPSTVAQTTSDAEFVSNYNRVTENLFNSTDFVSQFLKGELPLNNLET